jgi:hypothetical protein
MRKLASVRRVADIVPIEGADNIVVAKIGGWQVVTQKDWCKPGDLVCYFEIDSFLPVRPEYEFLRKSGFKSTKNLGDGFRLRSIKLRKQLSQGLIMPLSEVVAGHCAVEDWNSDREWPTPDRKHYVCAQCQYKFDAFLEGFDLTEFLGVQLYEKPIPNQLAGRIRGNFPHFIRKTDQERVQNLVNDIQHSHIDGDLYEVTIKLDGSSMTVYNKTDEDGNAYQGVCSRNWDLDANQEDERKNAFWECAKLHRLTDIVRQMKEDTGIDYALQGELMGPGVQDNREGLKQLEFFLFDIWDIDNQCYLSVQGRRHLAMKYGIQHVPFQALVPP